MEVEEWYVGKSSAYTEAVAKFVEIFGEDADLDRDIEPEPSDPDDCPAARKIKREAVVEFIRTLHPQESEYFDDDALAALNTQRELDRQDYEDKYGHLNEYGEPINQQGEDD